jgi:hypothetical protein
LGGGCNIQVRKNGGWCGVGSWWVLDRFWIYSKGESTDSTDELIRKYERKRRPCDSNNSCLGNRKNVQAATVEIKW